MGIEIGKRKIVYTTSKSNDHNLKFVKRRRIEDSSSSSEDDIASSPRSTSSSSQGSEVEQVVKDGDLDVSLRQSVDGKELEITKKREEILSKLAAESSKPDNDSKPHWEKVKDWDRSEIRKWYVDHYKIPKILYANELVEKATPLLPTVKDMYRGIVDSHYKFEANEMKLASHRGILSMQEFRNMDLTKFTAGYYGFKRQFKIGEIILNRYKPFLLKRQGDTMKWWGLSDFVNYVLAPEVLVSLCIKEMQLSDDIYDKSARETAYDIFANTIEFGTLIADHDPLEPWEVQLDEL